MSRRGSKAQPEPWRIHFFQRHKDDDPTRTVPATNAFDDWPEAVVAEIQAVLDAVSEAPPPAFSGGGKWEAMHGEMKDFYEVRVRGNPSGELYRVFCVLERNASDLGGPSLVVIQGMSKRAGSTFTSAEYRRVRSLGNEFRKRRTVLN
jgi:hypothetical protein